MHEANSQKELYVFNDDCAMHQKWNSSEIRHDTLVIISKQFTNSCKYRKRYDVMVERI